MQEELETPQVQPKESGIWFPGKSTLQSMKTSIIDNFSKDETGKDTQNSEHSEDTEEQAAKKETVMASMIRYARNKFIENKLEVCGYFKQGTYH
jgi:hypothetical protein